MKIERPPAPPLHPRLAFPFICQTCSRQFFAAEHLDRHIEAHVRREEARSR